VPLKKKERKFSLRTGLAGAIKGPNRRVLVVRYRRNTKGLGNLIRRERRKHVIDEKHES